MKNKINKIKTPIILQIQKPEHTEHKYISRLLPTRLSDTISSATILSTLSTKKLLPIRLSFITLVCTAILYITGCSSTPKQIACQKPGTLNYQLYQKSIASVLHDNGMIDYRKLKRNHKLLDQFVNSLKCLGPQTTPQFFPTQQDKIAFWINAHNAIALWSAVKKYPCKSVYSFWQDFNTSTKTYIDGQLMSLAQIAENARKASNYDPRIELTLAIPAKGSPTLTKQIYSAENLDDQLNQAVQRALDNNKLILIAHEEWALKLGKPFWRVRKKFIEHYEHIFGTTQASIINALGLYATDSQRRRLNTAIGYYVKPLPFDWTLNDDSEPPCSLDNINIETKNNQQSAINNQLSINTNQQITNSKKKTANSKQQK